MEDAQLANYLPSYGDRIALFNFCKRQTQSSKRKQGLLEKLREKLKLRKENHTGEEEPETSNKTKKARAKTLTRNIEIGWVHTDGKITKQVRAKQGGGTRKISVNIQAGFEEILKQGKSLFFPDGESSKGHESDFEFDVWDFKQNPFPKDVSIEMIYNTVKLPLLRFYISTQPKSVQVKSLMMMMTMAVLIVSLSLMMNNQWTEIIGRIRQISPMTPYQRCSLFMKKSSQILK